ncbi:MAG: adenylyltransferase/cytidyltransferase family protein, partial [Proteobacteria bacterium]|nr:adenylyltransferase/cytidyltransferase family protein [Pseudomonadota bacterium]
MDPAPIVNNLPDLISLLDKRRQGKRLVCTIGSWDILHQGHIEYLKRARELGDILVVGVDSDVAYQRHKGKPSMYPQDDRQNIVSALRYVDYVTIVQDVDSTGKWQMELIKSLKPDVFACNDRSFSDDQRTKLAKLCP